MSLTIRPIEPSDRAVWEKLFTAYGVFYETDFDAPVIDGVWRWLMDAEHPVNALVAVSNDTVTGFALFREQPDTFTAGPSWYLDDLYVDPATRGLGAGTALIAAITEHAVAHGGGTIRWITGAENATAQSVYDRVASKKTWITYELEA